MAEKYYLGPNAARRLGELLRGKMGQERISYGTPGMSEELAWPHPFEVTYATDSGTADDETGEMSGAWIIWVPDGSVIVDGVEKDPTNGLAPAVGYPTGWWDLTSIFDEAPAGAFDLYLDIGADPPEFTVDDSDATKPVLIAQILADFTVKGVVESALVFAEGGKKKPFDIETVDVGGTPVKKVVRCTWMTGGVDSPMNDFTLTDISGGSSVYAVVRIAGLQNGTAGAPVFTVEQYASGTAPAAQQGVEGQFCGYVKLYDLDDACGVVVDYRDAQVTLDWLGVDNNSVSYGDDGQAASYLHLKDFYNSTSNLPAIPTGCMLLARVPVDGQFTLAYVPTSLFVVTGGGGSGGGGTTSGYSGDVVLCTVPRYDPSTHKLLYTPVTLTFADGLLQSMVAATSETEITTAVEETV